jgi:GNAT superfamily N-acetyltransferase
MKVTVSIADSSQYETIGKLMVQVYSQLDGFPKQHEQPAYYNMLANVGDLTNKPGVELLVATDDAAEVLGAVVYFADMRYYGSGGTATQERDAAGFRLLAVDVKARGNGVGKLLTSTCIEKARAGGVGQVIIHTTQAMQTAWTMYEGMGFRRSPDLDFVQGGLPVFGFRLILLQRFE